MCDREFSGGLLAESAIALGKRTWPPSRTQDSGACLQGLSLLSMAYSVSFIHYARSNIPSLMVQIQCRSQRRGCFAPGSRPTWAVGHAVRNARLESLKPQRAIVFIDDIPVFIGDIPVLDPTVIQKEPYIAIVPIMTTIAAATPVRCHRNALPRKRPPKPSAKRRPPASLLLARWT